MSGRVVLAVFVAALLVAPAVAAQPNAAPPATGRGTLVDRAVVRFVAPETGGVRSPRFVFERELAFEARLEALADPDRGSSSEPYKERHVRAALERHIAETLLASLRIDPDPTAADLARQTEAARQSLYERVGGAGVVDQAARAEVIDAREVTSMLRRQARASLYLDRMVAPMLRPSDAELASIHKTAPPPLRDQPFGQVSAVLRRWYVSRRLGAALQSFFQNARSRLEISLLP